MIINYPENFPCPTWSYGTDTTPYPLRTQFDNGWTRQRRAFPQTGMSANLTFKCDTVMWEKLSTWLGADGWGWFRIPLDNGDGTIDEVVRLITPPTWGYDAYDNVIAMCTVEVSPDDTCRDVSLPAQKYYSCSAYDEAVISSLKTASYTVTDDALGQDIVAVDKSGLPDRHGTIRSMVDNETFVSGMTTCESFRFSSMKPTNTYYRIYQAGGNGSLGVVSVDDPEWQGGMDNATIHAFMRLPESRPTSGCVFSMEGVGTGATMDIQLRVYDDGFGADVQFWWSYPGSSNNPATHTSGKIIAIQPTQQDVFWFGIQIARPSGTDTFGYEVYYSDLSPGSTFQSVYTGQHTSPEGEGPALFSEWDGDGYLRIQCANWSIVNSDAQSWDGNRIAVTFHALTDTELAILSDAYNRTDRLYQDPNYPPEPTADPYWNNVVMLLNFDGADGSTTFQDVSRFIRPVTAVGGANISTTDPKFGSGCLELDGGGDGVELPVATDLDFMMILVRSWTLEGWVKYSVINRNGCLFQRSENGQGRCSMTFSTTSDNTIFITVDPDFGTAVTVTSTDVVSTTDYHFMTAQYDEDTGNLSLWLDGKWQGSSQRASGFGYGGVFNRDTARLGVYTQDSFSINGRMDDWRITERIARYAEGQDFNPPTSAFPIG